MKIKNKDLTNDLLIRMDEAVRCVQKLQTLPIATLNSKMSDQQWSALECIEHLNLYGDFYLPEIEKQLRVKPVVPATQVFSSGILGNYFAGLMQKNKKGVIKKMQAPKDKLPASSGLTTVTLDRFLKQAEKLRQLLKQAEMSDLTKTKTAISLTKMVRLRLGDTLRFVVYHIERHIAQAERAV